MFPMKSCAFTAEVGHRLGSRGLADWATGLEGGLADWATGLEGGLADWTTTERYVVGPYHGSDTPETTHNIIYFEEMGFI